MNTKLVYIINIYNNILCSVISVYLNLYSKKVVENQYFTFGFCFIDLPRYLQIPG